MFYSFQDGYICMCYVCKCCINLQHKEGCRNFLVTLCMKARPKPRKPYPAIPDLTMHSRRLPRGCRNVGVRGVVAGAPLRNLEACEEFVSTPTIRGHWVWGRSNRRYWMDLLRQLSIQEGLCRACMGSVSPWRHIMRVWCEFDNSRIWG